MMCTEWQKNALRKMLILQWFFTGAEKRCTLTLCVTHSVLGLDPHVASSAVKTHLYFLLIRFPEYKNKQSNWPLQILPLELNKRWTKI